MTPAGCLRAGCGGLIVAAAAILVMVLSGQGWSFFGGNQPGGGGGPTPTPTPTARFTPTAKPTATPSPTPGPGTTIPTISARTYSAGSTPVTVTGTFSFSSTIALHILDAFSDGVETTLNYGFQLESGGVLLGFSQRPGADGFSLNVNYGTWMATYVGEGCTWEVEVTDVTLSGHVSCKDIPAVSEPDGTPGVVDIELDFTADS
jgi:hypothetical protein